MDGADATSGWRLGTELAVSEENRSALDELERAAQVWAELTSGVTTSQWLQQPITQQQFERVKETCDPNVHWAFVTTTGGKIWAVDRVSDRVDASTVGAAVLIRRCTPAWSAGGSFMPGGLPTC